jgi:hypothetical protein
MAVRPSTATHVPGAAGKIVFDRFHIMQHMVDAVNTVRKKEHRELLAAGDETLKGTRNLWLYSQENVPEKDLDRFDALKSIHLRTSRAWAIKESLRAPSPSSASAAGFAITEASVRRLRACTRNHTPAPATPSYPKILSQNT